MNENWNLIQKKILETAKFPAKESLLTIEPKPEPQSITEDGKFGKQTIYIVKSKEIGMIKVSQRQFLKICDAFQGDFSSAVTVQF